MYSERPEFFLNDLLFRVEKMCLRSAFGNGIYTAVVYRLLLFKTLKNKLLLLK